MATRKSFAAQINAKVAPVVEPEPVAPAGPEPTAAPQAAAAEIEFRKFTAPLRTDQIDDLNTILATFYLEHRITLSKASIIRHGLELALAEAKADPDRFLQALQALETKELAMNANRKHSISPGLADHKAK